MRAVFELVEEARRRLFASLLAARSTYCSAMDPERRGLRMRYCAEMYGLLRRCNPLSPSTYMYVRRRWFEGLQNT